MWKLKAKMACERTEMMKLRERERKKEGQSQRERGLAHLLPLSPSVCVYSFPWCVRWDIYAYMLVTELQALRLGVWHFFFFFWVRIRSH